MDITIKDFFKPLDLVVEPTEEKYNVIETYIDFAKKFSLSTYQSIYIIDYYKRGFAYVSDNPLFLCGNKPSVVLKMGYSFYMKYVPKDDLEMLLEINKAGFSFFNDIAVDERLDYSISYDFNIVQQNKRSVLINHKLIPLLLDKNANIWLALCAVSISSNNVAGNVFIRKQESDQMFHYDLIKKSWNMRPVIKISHTEKEILFYSSQGNTVDEIGKKLSLSASTIKFHRKRIFLKMNVKNISEAISFAANYNLI